MFRNEVQTICNKSEINRKLWGEEDYSRVWLWFSERWNSLLIIKIVIIGWKSDSNPQTVQNISRVKTTSYFSVQREFSLNDLFRYMLHWNRTKMSINTDCTMAVELLGKKTIGLASIFAYYLVYLLKYTVSYERIVISDYFWKICSSIGEVVKTYVRTPFIIILVATFSCESVEISSKQ